MSQLMVCVVFAAAILLLKGVPVGGGKAGDYAYKVIHHTTDIRKTAGDVMAFVGASELLPAWVKGSAAPTPAPTPEATPAPTSDVQPSPGAPSGSAQ